MQTLQEGQTFVVEQVSDTDGDLWYLINADAGGMSGWINSIALLPSLPTYVRHGARKELE